jgi:endoglucanase
MRSTFYLKWKLIVLLCCIINVVYAQTAPTPVSKNGQLSVCGTKLCNQYGKPIQLRGMSTHGLQWYSQCLTDASLNALAYDWGSDVLRISMYIQEGGYESNPVGFTNQVKSLVNKATELGMYALIDFHQLTPGDPNHNTNHAKTFFTEMANTFKNYTNVIYDICNEPNGVTWNTIRNYAVQVIPVIRAIDSDAVVLVGTHGWSTFGVSGNGTLQDVINNPLPYQNVMYTFHFYAASHGQTYLNMLDNASNALPVFVTEFGTQTASGDGANNFSMSQQYIDLMRNKKISWCNWNYSDDFRTGAVWNQGICEAKGPWVENSLKPAGKTVRGWMLVPADDFPGGDNNTTPAAPSNLAATVSGTSATLTWTDNSNNETGFRIERSTSITGSWSNLASTGINATSYVVTGISTSSPYYYRVSAVNANGSSPSNTVGPIPTTPGTVNLALNKSVTVSSTETAALGGANAVDGNVSTRWASSYNDNQHITVDLAAVSSITKVVLKWETAYAKTYRLETSNDGSNFTLLVNQTNSDGATDEYTVSSSARYVRMYGLTRATQWGMSLWEFEVWGTQGTVTTPSAPANLSAVATSQTQINLSWTDNANNETGFRIQRSTNSGSTWSDLTTLGANVTSYSNSGLTASTTYHYRVRAENASGNSGYSNVANATTQGTGTVPPEAPGNLSATSFSASQINLSWTDNSTNETGFRIERSTDGSSWSQFSANVGANITTYQSTGLSASTTYYYRVRAENGGGNSSYTSVASATTQGTTGGGCSGVAAYAAGVSYNAGDVVQNIGNKYECKPWPYSGWCGAGASYAPGVGFASEDAWTFVGSCSGSARSAQQVEADGLEVYPTVSSTGNAGIIKLTFEKTPGTINVQLGDMNGSKVLERKIEKTQSSSMDFEIPVLSDGLYLIKVQSGNKTWVKKYWIKK